jgi:hypothetical protein
MNRRPPNPGHLANCGILAELNPGSLIPHALVMNALRLLCQEVVPRFH